MKYGILTFQSYLNYGSLLQAFALRQFMHDQGRTVWVINRWFDKDNYLLLGPFAKPTPTRLCKILLQILLMCGFFADARRRLRTIRFRKWRLHLTATPFREWPEIGNRPLEFDCVVVGSDQVWNCIGGYPGPFLLEKAPPSLQALAYSASFGGMTQLREEDKALFLTHLPRFSSVSAREDEGVELLRSVGREDAVQVLDPTQLLPASQWRQEFQVKPPQKDEKPKLLCYLLYLESQPYLKSIRAFQKQQGCTVDLFLSENAALVPRDKAHLIRHFKALPSRFFSPIRFRMSAGPEEFIRTFMDADWVVANSYHALMFASIFDKNIRLIRSKTSGMARFNRFMERYVQGPLFADTMEEALVSLARGEVVRFDQAALDADRERSREWLRQALKKVEADTLAQR